jgi:putative flippase GtrA
VDGIHRLYRQFQQLIQEGAKFGVIGAIAFVITFVGTNLLHYQVGVGPLSSNTIATIAATIFAFAGNRYWTFRHRERSGMGREGVLFFVFNGIGLVIQLACLGLVRYVLGLTDPLSLNAALFVGVVLGTLFRFWSYRKWVWLDSTQVPAVPVPGHEARPQPEPAGLRR